MQKINLEPVKLKQNRNSVIDRLQQKIRVELKDTLTSSKKFSLLDYPNHSNVGDSAIWLGEIAYFSRQLGLYPDYVCGIENYNKCDLKEAIDSNSTIFLHGGGNFGDLWPAHHNFREQIIRDFPDHKIVQLPQSIHFKSPEALARTARNINAHKDFTLIVRDHNSLKIAQENFTCKIKLCPDMAFFLGPLSRPISARHPLLFLHRTDSENAYSNDEFSKDADVTLFQTDWLNEPDGLDLKVKRQVIYQLALVLGFNMFKKFRRRELWYRRLAETRLKRGIDLLSGAEFIITDRLHVHIVSLLLNIPHVAMDNSYGKIRNFIEAWTKDSDLLEVATDWPSALHSYQIYGLTKPAIAG